MRRSLKDALEHLVVIEIFVLLTVIAFRGIFVLGFDKFVIGDGGDAYQYIWDMWWARNSLEHHLDYFYTNYLFYPHGTSLVFDALNAFWSFASVPFQYLFSLVQIYNAIILLTFVLSGYSMYLLVNCMTKNKLVALWSGVAFAFLPFHLGRALGQPDLASIFVFPLLVFFMLKTLESRRFVSKYLIAAGLILALSMLTYPYYLIFSGLLVLVFLLVEAFGRHWKNVSKILLIYAIALVLLSPWLVRAIGEMGRFEHPPESSIGSRDMLFYFLPSPFSDLGARLFQTDWYYPLYTSMNSICCSLSDASQLGYVLIVLAGLGIFTAMKDRNRKLIATLFVAGLVLFVASLGKEVRIMGLHFPSPLFWLIHNAMPFLRSHDFTTASIIPGFSLVAIASWYLAKIVKKNTRGLLLLSLITVLTLYEFFPAHYWYSNSVTYQEANQLASIPDNSVVLTLPPYTQYGDFLQTIHGARMPDGYFSHPNEQSLGLFESLKLHVNQPEKIMEDLKSVGINYMLVNKEEDGLTANYGGFSSLRSITRTPNITMVFYGENLDIYKVG